MTIQKTRQQEAIFQTIKAVAEAIKDLGTVPSGHLYARIMHVMSLDEYNQIIAVLKQEGLIEESHYELKWIG